MHNQRKNSLDPVIIEDWRWSPFLDQTIKAFSIVNPNRYDDNSNLKYLCAAGVCFMFLVALNKKLREIKWFQNKSIEEPDLISYLDLVSLATVCDVVPLVGLNRAIVKQGLKVLSKRLLKTFGN